jgi:phosphate transport system substrate-binding protein
MKYCLCFLAIVLGACSKDNTIKIKGSDTEVNLAVLLAESFHAFNSNLFVSISGGGSGLGITSLLNGTADIANSSRSMNGKEKDLFHKKGIQIDSFVFAQDAIAFVVADDLAIDSINLSDLKKILAGESKDWFFLTGKHLPVNIYGRQSNSGTHGFIKKKLGIEFSPYAKQMNGNAQILEAIKSDHSGIGYVGAGYIMKGSNRGLKVLSIYHEKNTRAISPQDSTMIMAGLYYFQRPLFQYYKATSYKKIRPFIDYEKTEEGQKIIQQAGYYPIKQPK